MNKKIPFETINSRLHILSQKLYVKDESCLCCIKTFLLNFIQKTKMICIKLFKHIAKNLTTYFFGIIILFLGIIFSETEFIANYVNTFSFLDITKLHDDNAIVNYLIAKNTHGTTLLTIYAGFMAMLLAFWRAHNFDRNRSNDEKKEINERYIKTLELLNSEIQAIRIGALYSLKQISEENINLNPQCIKIIENYFVNKMQNKEVKTIQNIWNNRFEEWRQSFTKNSNCGYIFQTDIDWDFLKQPHWALPEDLNVALDILSSAKFNKNQKINLQYIDFRGCGFLRCKYHFKSIDFSGSDFSYCKFNTHTNFSDCDLRYCKFVNTYIADAVIVNSQLVNINFEKALLQCTTFKNCNLNGANFSFADLQCCTFNNSYMAYSSFYCVDMGTIPQENLLKNINLNSILLDEENYNKIKEYIPEYEYIEILEPVKEHFVDKTSLNSEQNLHMLQLKS